MQAMLDAVREGATDDAIEGVEVLAVPALSATAVDVLAADGVLLGTPANIGYMSGALKHFFDTVYYPCLDAKAGTPYGLYVHGGNDATGAVRSVETVTKGLSWRAVAAPLTVTGEPGREQLAACCELGGVLAATLLE